ncbi:MAG TPA: DUF4307 domain-containing protein [Micromonosporaceae bacterium]|nr:DUF4307 domain-containing protein [Micromonosporaceae bacterium]
MTETHATAPAFPPGRYGRRRQARRTPRWLPVVLALVVVATGFLLAVRLYEEYGDPTYRVSTTRYGEITDDGVTVDFTVLLPPGGSAVCVVRARAYSGKEVGSAEVTVAAPPGTRSASSSYRLATTERPYMGEAIRCGPPRS